MIRTSYSFKLARTKLRSKRGILVTSIIVASLLFAALIATVVVFSGAEKSASEFIKKAGNDRYLVKTSPNIPYEKLSFLLIPSLADIREIKSFEKVYYQELREKYKSLGLQYDEKSEVPALEPYVYADKTLPEEQRVRVNLQSPVIQEMDERKFEEYYKTATNKLSNLKEAGAKYGASGYSIVDKNSGLPNIPGLRLIQNNKEDISDLGLKSGDSTSYGYYTNAIHNGMYGFTDQKNLSRYLLTTDTENLEGIPVIVSAQEAASLFGNEVGVGEEPDAPAEKKTWLKNVQSKLNKHIYQVCYRNSVEQALLDKIQRDFAEMKNNEGNKEYEKPSLTYNYPEGACDGITIKEDTRTVTEKQSEAKLEETQKKLGTYVAPEHKLLTFQIVGVKYAQPYLDYTKGINEYLKSLLVSQNSPMNIDIPIQMYNSLPDTLKFDDVVKQQAKSGTVLQRAFENEDFAMRVLEFTNVEDARSFLNKETCPASETDCDKAFIGDPYGSNYLILDEISKLFNKVVTIAFPAALGLAAIIIWFTISRIMAENRKETAVYRAMGAKRRDVTGIYIVYIFLVALQIAMVSVILGLAAAFTIDYFYGNALTDTAVTAFGIIDDAPRFSLFSIDSPLLLIVVASIFLISFIASIQPLIRNVRRSPIHDMREE